MSTIAPAPPAVPPARQQAALLPPPDAVADPTQTPRGGALPPPEPVEQTAAQPTLAPRPDPLNPGAISTAPTAWELVAQSEEAMAAPETLDQARSSGEKTGARAEALASEAANGYRFAGIVSMGEPDPASVNRVA